MVEDFKGFLTRGNVVDLAVALVMGAAFGGIVTSLVNDILMPPIGLALKGVDFTNLFVSLSGQSYPSLAAAKAAGAPTVNYGLFVNTIISFVIVAFAMFLIVRQTARFRPAPPAPAATTRECPFCLSAIPVRATRCAHCTSNLG
ncbi:MAG TPA: large conductance mechanosensitive channel protein MscL [Methylomirabilota bacterium]|jgi:large conductance mechanosensitive channel